MASTSLNAIASYATLDRAWRDLFKRSRPKSRNTLGIDDASINDFARDPKPRLRMISTQLKSGEFAFNRLRPHLVIKPDGKKYRLICVPTVNDRVVQRALLDFLTDKYGSRFKNSISYGFIKGRSLFSRPSSGSSRNQISGRSSTTTAGQLRGLPQ